MGDLIQKLQSLHQSTQKLESALHDFWSLVDEVKEDEEYSQLAKMKKQNSTVNFEELSEKMKEFTSYLEEIPEDGTVAIDVEDAVSELMEMIKQNK